MSTVTEQLFSKIAETESEQRAMAFPEYKGILVQLMNGEEVDPAAAKFILDKMNKSQADLDADVATLRKRTQAVADFAKLEQREADYSKAAKALADHQKAKEEFLEKWKVDNQQLNEQVNLTSNALSRSTQARATLANCVLDPTVAIEQKQLSRELVELSELIDRRCMNLEDVNKQILQFEGQAKGKTLKDLPEATQEDIARLTDSRKSIASKIKELEARKSEILERQEELRANQFLEA